MSTSTRNGAGPGGGTEDEPPRGGARGAAEQAWNAQVNALGGFIRAQRQMAKLSLREMAAMTSVSNAYLSQVERGLHQPSLKVLRSIADALHLNTDQMLRQAGWSTADDESEEDVEPATSSSAVDTEAVIRADPRLSEEQRTALIGVYRSFVDRA
ncbi:transcriptional regulator with XRE-family HTH domain [Pseudonocardia sediminis]|uniref:Transcriptional regulator with XRE-family HTH domain n=1 Tax=Pseudonocardia sediminis TaxID=1397368 RepID=A0A4Q7UW78_PSEST|nr:helix-turn-helix domain-containing protein [Pseudonocardia sediminis]RZT85354.1 transcriptional regulator with XRE-family HTH domain [Pseudonocardia sediminis]